MVWVGRGLKNGGVAFKKVNAKSAKEGTVFRALLFCLLTRGSNHTKAVPLAWQLLRVFFLKNRIMLVESREHTEQATGPGASLKQGKL